MARYTGPVYKKSRRLGFSILESGKELAKRPYAPGAHGNDKKRKSSEYGIQLAEKQKIRLMYGLNEKQFHKLYEKAAKMQGPAGQNLLCLLESRLDNLVYRMGMAKTRRAARQVVNHGHITVNGVKVNVPSYQVRVGDVVAVKENSIDHPAIKEAVETCTHRPAYVEFDQNKLTGKFLRLPDRSELNQEVNETLIVEYYNR